MWGLNAFSVHDWELGLAYNIPLLYTFRFYG